MIVACLGSSTTAGKGQAYDWVGSLARNLADKHIQFRNFGVGGDLAYNALQRVSEVVSSRPDKVVVLVGGNDVLARASAKARRFYRIFKGISAEPSAELLSSEHGPSGAPPEALYHRRNSTLLIDTDWRKPALC